MSRVTFSVDVPDIRAGVQFFTDGLGFRVNAALTQDVYELELDGVRLFLLEQPAGSSPAPDAEPRSYGRHWTPVHLDLEVTDFDSAVERAVRAGATVEHESDDPNWGRIATLADPFGHGLCLIRPASSPDSQDNADA